MDWTVPKEWNIKDAYIITPEGEKTCDFKNKSSCLNYTSVDRKISLTELQNHLYSLL